MFPLAYYGMGVFNAPEINVPNVIFNTALVTIISETAVIVFTEIYFKLLYSNTLKELRKMLGHLEAEN